MHEANYQIMNTCIWLITFEIACDAYICAAQLPGSKVIVFAASVIFEIIALKSAVKKKTKSSQASSPS